MTFSERTKNVARAQVQNKANEAKRLTLEAMRECMEARSEEEYNLALEKGVKAAHDYQVWRRVLEAL